MSSIPCMAFQKRKEKIETQMREHQEARQMAKKTNSSTNLAQSKCPMSGIKQEEQEPVPVKTEEAKDNCVELNNKKVVVSIQSSEDKQNENNLS